MTERVHNGLSYRQGIDAVVRLLGGTGTSWVPAVLAALAVGRLRSSELLDAINRAEARWRHTTHARPLSPKVFRDTVRRMERDGLLTREATQTYPSTTWYELTPVAWSLLAVLRPVAEWAQTSSTWRETTTTPERATPAIGR